MTSRLAVSVAFARAFAPGVVLVAVAFCAVAPRVEAADAPPAVSAPTTPAPAAALATTASPAVRAEARERFDTGLHLFEKGEQAGALAEFKRAYQLVPSPVVLYNIGLVFAAMNRPVDSVDTLGQFLADAGGAGREQKAHAEQVRAEQTKRIAQLVVLTEHPATVEVDGVEVGRTPLSKPIRVASGSHVVAIEAPGFLGSRREVTLAGQLTETIAMAMQPTDTRMAQLVVTSALPGVEVVVNGKRVGATPLPASVAVAPGKVRVELQRAGYLTSAQEIALDEGAHGELTFSLQEDPAAPAALRGRLVIVASEPGAELSLDGTARRPLVGAVSLPVGPHHVRVEKLGFDTVARSVEVRNGQDASLLVTLVATPEMQAQLDSNRNSRRVVGWSLFASGLALAAGGGILALVSNNDLSEARKQYDLNVTMPWKDVASLCHGGPGSTNYVNHQCGDVAAAYQQPIDSASVKRGLGIAVGGAGIAGAVIGGYLLATGGGGTSARVTMARVWSDDRGAGGLTLGGLF